MPTYKKLNTVELDEVIEPIRWSKWDDYMENVNTKEELNRQLENYKKDVLDKIKNQRDKLVLNEYALPRVILQDKVIKHFGKIYIGYDVNIKPYKLVEKWLESLGIEFITHKTLEYVYFTLINL